MRDGNQCSISLTHSTRKHSVHYYHLQLHLSATTCRLSLRYSQLRTIAPLLPKSELKFPEPSHFASLLSQLAAKDDFFIERQRQLTCYFQSVSRMPQLENSQGFNRLIALGCSSEEEGEELVSAPPVPRIVGKKLSARPVELVC